MKAIAEPKLGAWDLGELVKDPNGPEFKEFLEIIKKIRWPSGHLLFLLLFIDNLPVYDRHLNRRLQDLRFRNGHQVLR